MYYLQFTIVSVDPANIRIYPNPASDEILIESVDSATYSILDMNGNEMFCTEKNRINISGLPCGMYIVQIQFGENSVNKIFVKN